MKAFKLMFCLLLWVGISFAQKQALTIKPSTPKIGEEVKLTYSPQKSSSGLTGVTTVNAEVLFINSGMVDVQKIEMKLSKGNWKSTLTVPEKGSLFIVKLTSGDKTDDNNGDCWKFPVYGKDKKPVENAYFYPATLHQRGELQGFKLKKSPEDALKCIEKELASYPYNTSALQFKWSQMMSINKSDETKAQVQKELLTFFNAKKSDEKAIFPLLSTFTMVGLEKRGKEIKDSLIASNPSGYTAFQEKLRTVMMNPNTPPETIEKLFTDFPDMEVTNRNMLVNILVNAYIKAKNYDKANEFLVKQNSNDGMIYNSLAWPLIEKGENLEKATAWAAKGVELVRNKKMENKSSDLKLAKSIDASLGMILDTYGYGQEQLGNTNDALKAYEESFVLNEGNEESINQRYVLLLTKAGNYKKAVEVAEACLLKEKANDKIINAYKESYLKLNGSSSEAEAKVNKLVAEAKARMVETLKKEMINKPAPDFNLKDFNGNYVKLSDLKGKVVVVDFWATWCGPCKVSFPALQKVQEKYKDNPNILILALDTWEREKTVEEKEKKVKDFIAENKYTFKVLFDTDDIVTKYGVTGIPTKFVIDKDGMMQFKSVGFAGEQKMIAELEAQFELLLNK